MKRYGQYCPIVRASEIFAERWTPVIIRNILLGCRTFTEIERGAPGISKTLLTERLRELVHVGVLERTSLASGPIYTPTAAGRELWAVCEALGVWGAKWLEVAPEHLDPYVVLWAMCNSLDPAEVPDRRVVVKFEFSDLQRRNRFWWLLENGRAEVCVKPPGFAEDLVIRGSSEHFAKWHMGWVSWRTACVSGGLEVEGPRDLVRGFPRWNRRSPFAGVPRAKHPIGPADE